MEVLWKVFLSKYQLTGLILRYEIYYDHKNIFSTQGPILSNNLRILVIGFSVCPLRVIHVFHYRVGS
jgi:hypothetical protein